MVTLVIPDAGMIAAALEDPPALAARLEAEPAEGWVGFTDALQHVREALEGDPGFARWGTRLFVMEEPRTLVGWGGFKGPPKNGAVELGYEIAPGLRNRGLATTAVAAMVDEAFADPDVRAILAHTLAGPGPSVRVLEKSGFELVGEIVDRDDGEVWRFRRDRG